MSFGLFGSAFIVGSTISAAFVNFVRASLASALDGAAGGAYAPTAKLQIGGLGLELTETSGAAKSVQLASRSRTILTDISRALPTTTAAGILYGWSFVTSDVWRNDAIEGAEITVPLDIPDGQVLNTVSVGWTGAAGHGALPGTMPTIQVFGRDIQGTATALAAETSDPSGNVGAYQAQHAITTGALAHTIDKATYSYFLLVTAEIGPNYLTDALLFSVASAVTITSLPEF